MLLNLAISSGVQFRFNTRIVDASTSPVSVSVMPSTGDSLEDSLSNLAVSNATLETLHADVLIGADGFDSLIRQVVTDSAGEVPDENDTHVVATMCIEISRMEEDEELKDLLEARNVSVTFALFFGTGRPRWEVSAVVLRRKEFSSVTFLGRARRRRWPSAPSLCTGAQHRNYFLTTYRPLSFVIQWSIWLGNGYIMNSNVMVRGSFLRALVDILTNSRSLFALSIATYLFLCPIEYTPALLEIRIHLHRIAPRLPRARPSNLYLLTQAGGTHFTATIIHNYGGPRWPGDLGWTEARSLKDLGIELDNFEPM